MKREEAHKQVGEWIDDKIEPKKTSSTQMAKTILVEHGTMDEWSFIGILTKSTMTSKKS